MRAHLDSQIGILAELTRKSYDTARRLNELHLELARDLFEDFYSISRQMVAANDPMELSGLMARQMQPFSDRMRNYVQQLGGVLGSVQLDITRAGETFMPEASRAARAFAAGAMEGDPSHGLFPFRPGGNGAA
jgi:phasin family protein